MRRFIGQLLRKRDGAVVVEYALIASLIAVAVVGGATSLGVSINNKFVSISAALTAAGGPAA